MHQDDPKGIRPQRKPNSPLLLAGIGAVGFVALLVVIIYLTDRLETLEDRLGYQAPLMKGEAGSAFGIDISAAQTVYVPVYSHIYAKGGEPFLLEATLSIRNSDPERAIDISSVRYYDTKGRLLQDYVTGVVKLQPLETTEILVEKRDKRGGSGANFIVAWSAAQPVYAPIVEAVMIGHAGNQSVSFKSIGRPLTGRTEQRSAPAAADERP